MRSHRVRSTSVARSIRRDYHIRPVVAPILVGLGLAGVFVVGRLLVREIDVLDGFVRSVVEYADEGSVVLLVLVTAVNGIAEELFFRGAVYAAVTRHPVPVTTLAYTVATLATGNIMLGFAAVVLGAVVGTPATGLRRDPCPDPHPRHLVVVDAVRPAGAVRLSCAVVCAGRGTAHGAPRGMLSDAGDPAGPRAASGGVGSRPPEWSAAIRVAAGAPAC